MRPENAEFNALFKLSGWTQVQAAKRFHCSQAVISRWLNGVDPAHRAAVDLFKFILASEQPDKIGPVVLREESISPWERKLIEELRPLHKEDRDRILKAVHALIHGLPMRPPIRYEFKPHRRDGGPKEN